jgi:hypothetical protein
MTSDDMGGGWKAARAMLFLQEPEELAPTQKIKTQQSVEIAGFFMSSWLRG